MIIAVLLLTFMPFDQDKFDNYINNDRVVLVKFIDDDIPALQMPIVRLLINRNNVVKMQGDSTELGGPFLGIFTKDTHVLFYGKHKK